MSAAHATGSGHFPRQVPLFLALLLLAGGAEQARRHDAHEDDANRIAGALDIGQRHGLSHPRVLLFRRRHKRLVEHVGDDHQHKAARDPEQRAENAVDRADTAVEDGVGVREVMR